MPFFFFYPQFLENKYIIFGADITQDITSVFCFCFATKAMDCLCKCIKGDIKR